MTVEETLASMGLTLPDASRPLASYVPAIRAGGLVFCSGQLPMQNGELMCRGQVGAEVTEREAYDAARAAALNCLAAIKSVIGDLDSIARVVKVTGYVNSGTGFTAQPSVINGASDLLVDVFGERGRHARAAIGVFGLPLGAAVEIEMIVEVEDPARIGLA